MPSSLDRVGNIGYHLLSHLYTVASSMETAFFTNIRSSRVIDSAHWHAWITHYKNELYIPLNAIQGHTELLMEGLEGFEQAHELTTQLFKVRLQNQRLITLVNQELNSEFLIHDSVLISSENKNRFDQSKLHLQNWIATNGENLVRQCKALEALSLAEVSIEIKKILTAAHKFYNLVTSEKTLNSPTDFTESRVLPCRKISCDTTPQYSENPSSCCSLVSRKAQILIVDDLSANRELLRHYIENQGHQATEASGGKQAIADIMSEPFDVILLDILMPEINGYQILKWLKGSQWQHIPVIMISALDEIKSVAKCIEMGAEDYLPKPFSQTILKARIEACLEKKRLRDQESSYAQKLSEANHEISNLNQKLRKENLRLNAELEVTRQLQQMILPKSHELNSIDELEITGFMNPAEKVGGDYYDVIKHKDTIQIGIGDVTGHGLESGVLMLMVQTTIRTLIENDETDQEKILDVVNRAIFHNVMRMGSDQNLTLTLMSYKTGKLTISGQHEEVLIFRNNGKIEKLDTINLGFPIGIEEDISEFINHEVIALDLEEVVVLYTDGITEAENKKGIFYGLERMCNRVLDHQNESVQTIKEAIIQDLYRHIEGGTIYDDITLLVLKRKR